MKARSGKSLRAQPIKMACYLWGVRPGTTARFIWGLLTLPDLTVCVPVCVYCVREADLTSLYTVYSVFGLPGNYESVMVSYEARFGPSLDWTDLCWVWSEKDYFLFFVCFWQNKQHLFEIYVQGDTEQGSLKQTHTSGDLPASKNKYGQIRHETWT